MKLLGIPYLTSALVSTISARNREEVYRTYVTDRLYTLCASWGNKPPKRYYDIINPEPEDPRSGEEIARERLESFGIKVV